ncbi:MAG: tripartite tricarboxylate transporter substrate binding protein [Gammaproteobacteria bacterium]|jgi:tripartite-type tricarboxylate transporter receptor subunit TctC|nr:tripartite tricarboxylate transporter substrate binding protein [Gammaproteobacteria bacterium]MBU0827108.1 tripartite tricarboxylate transporter substrate binding protein [Gammaproteobacteria bacterium]MBU0893700.1 tripartite tricarboxylate transporter substrate binding protein [Gammaproteobacteria bacterium]MBU1818549.1 tripartite tricarboxylate transporter substrate binding protein [Gammaproteobacteria bacterium]
MRLISWGRGVLGLAGLLACVSAVHAQPAWPDRPVRVIVPFPASGATDLVARVVTQRVAADLGQQMVVDNKPGAGGTLGTAEAAKAPADGYTLLLTTSSTHAISPHLMPKLAYDPRKDFVPVAHVADAPSVLLVTNSLPVKTVGELMAYAKANPGKLNYATSGNGTIVHLNTAAFSAQAGVEMTHIPYKGTALAIPDLIAGQTHVLFDSLPTGMPHAKAGRLRALAVTSEKRSSLAPELPTMAESGLPGYSSVTWFGVYLPANAPPALVQRIHAAFAKAVQSPEVAASLAKLGVEPAAPSTSAQFDAMVQADSKRWANVIRQHKISIE